MSIKLLPANQLESLTKFSTNSCNRSVLNVFHVSSAFDRPSCVVGRYHFGGEDIMVGSTIVSPIIVIPTILSPTILSPTIVVSPTIVGSYQLRKC